MSFKSQAKTLVKNKALRSGEINPLFPSRINIEPTNQCNLR